MHARRARQDGRISADVARARESGSVRGRGRRASALSDLAHGDACGHRRVGGHRQVGVEPHIDRGRGHTCARIDIGRTHGQARQRLEDVMNTDTRPTDWPLKIFSVNGVKEVLSRVSDDFHAETGRRLAFTFGTIGALQDKMASGEKPDALVAMAAAMTRAEQNGLVETGSSVEVGRTGLAAVVREGAPPPDISSTEAFRNALLSARSIAYTDPKTGAASGIAVAEILERLGIADQLKDKTVLVDGGPVGEVVARGDAELGIQQVTELLPVNGITFLSGFAAVLQRVTVYRAAGLRLSVDKPGTARFLSFVTSPRMQRRFADAGFGRY